MAHQAINEEIGSDITTKAMLTTAVLMAITVAQRQACTDVIGVTLSIEPLKEELAKIRLIPTRN